MYRLGVVISAINFRPPVLFFRFPPPSIPRGRAILPLLCYRTEGASGGRGDGRTGSPVENPSPGLWIVQMAYM